MSEQIEQARPRERVVVIGAGMVAHRFVEAMRSRDDAGRFDITVLGDERLAVPAAVYGVLMFPLAAGVGYLLSRRAPAREPTVAA